MATAHFSDAALCTVGSHTDIENMPDALQRQNMQKLQNKLEEMRAILSDYFGADTPIIITYGGRCPALNAACGGSPTSAHLEWLAADTRYINHGVGLVASILMRHATFMLDVDQLIIERNCLHLGLPCRASGYKARNELRHDRIVNGTRTYPLLTVWHRPTVADTNSR